MLFEVIGGGTSNNATANNCDIYMFHGEQCA